MFRKLRDRNGTPVVSLVPDHLRRDGLLDDEDGLPDDREMFVERVAEGAYIVLDTQEGDVPEIEELLASEVQ